MSDPDALRAWLEGRSDTPPDGADLDALLADADPALFAETARRLAIPDPDDGVIDAAWDRLNAALPAPEGQVVTPPPAARRRWGMWIAAGVALAAGLLIFALRPTPTEAPRDRWVKGAAAPGIEVEFLREGPGGVRSLVAPAQAAQDHRLIARVRLSDPAWIGLIHRGPDGKAQLVPFAAGVLPPGEHTPQADGEVIAYGFQGEPGRHGFEIWASPTPLSLEQINAMRAAPPAHIARRGLTVDVR